MPTTSADDYSDRLTLGTTTPSEDMTHEESQTSEFTSSSDGEAPQREAKEAAESGEKKENIK